MDESPGNAVGRAGGRIDRAALASTADERANNAERHIEAARLQRLHAAHLRGSYD